MALTAILIDTLSMHEDLSDMRKALLLIGVIAARLSR